MADNLGGLGSNLASPDMLPITSAGIAALGIVGGAAGAAGLAKTPASVLGGPFKAVGQAVGKFFKGKKPPKPNEKSKRVGRHMHPDELEKMKQTGRVQEGGGGQMRVADPANPNSYKNAPDGDVYVEFDVPAGRVLPHSQGTGRIPGPNSPDARVPGRDPADYEMPSANNIEVPG